MTEPKGVSVMLPDGAYTLLELEGIWIEATPDGYTFGLAGVPTSQQRTTSGLLRLFSNHVEGRMLLISKRYSLIDTIVNEQGIMLITPTYEMPIPLRSDP